jgi:hypothetical protein
MPEIQQVELELLQKIDKTHKVYFLILGHNYLIDSLFSDQFIFRNIWVIFSYEEVEMTKKEVAKVHFHYDAEE